MMIGSDDKDIALTVRMSPQLVEAMEKGKDKTGIEASAEFIRYLVKSFADGIK